MSDATEDAVEHMAGQAAAAVAACERLAARAAPEDRDGFAEIAGLMIDLTAQFAQLLGTGEAVMLEAGTGPLADGSPGVLISSVRGDRKHALAALSPQHARELAGYLTEIAAEIEA